MSMLVWDATAERLYETGTKMGVLYPQNAAGQYPIGYAWNGLTAVTESPSGAESNKQYADDIPYLDLYSAEEFGYTIEAFMYPWEFAECDGSAEVADGVVIGQQPRKPFGFCYRTVLGNDTEGNDHGYKLHLIYNSKASPSERGYQTVNDSPEPITFSWECSTTPVNVRGYKPCSQMTIDSTKCNAEALTALEAVLYGDASHNARLPLPDEVLSILAGASGTVTYTVVENPTGDPSALGYYVRLGNAFVKSTDASVVEGTVYYERTVA